MSKFIYAQDIHITGSNSEYRIGNYYSDIMTKFTEILDLAKDNKVDGIIDGGDLLNSKLVSNIIVDDILNLIEKYNIKYYSLYGNHPLIAHSIELSKASSLAHMFNRCKIMSHLEEIEEDNYYIKAYDFYHNIEQDIKDNGFIHDKKDKFTMAVTHAMITEKPFHPAVLHVQIKDIKTNYDVVLIGHYHIPWGIKEINNTKFINIGCIGRKSIDEKDIKPSVLLIDTDNKTLDIIELKSAKSALDVFNFEKYSKKKEFEGNINKFMESLDSTELQSIDIIGKVVEIGKNSNTDKEIIDDLVKRISIVQNKGENNG